MTEEFMFICAGCDRTLEGANHNQGDCLENLREDKFSTIEELEKCFRYIGGVPTDEEINQWYEYGGLESEDAFRIVVDVAQVINKLEKK